MPTETAETTTATTKTHRETRQEQRARAAQLAELDRRFWLWCDLHDRAITRAVALFDQMQAAGPDDWQPIARRWHRAWSASSRCLDRIRYYRAACTAAIYAEEARP